MSLYENFRDNLKRSAKTSGRSFEEIDLIAVSKKKPIEVIRQVIQAGHRSFGENQIQEVENKWIKLKKEYPDLKLHFIGGIQSRKVKSIFDHCDVIHSVDRIKIIELFSNLEEQRGVSKEYFIQVNTGNEPQKSGISPLEVDSFIKYCIKDLNLPIIGLMCIPPINEEPSMHFLLLQKIANRNNLSELSMGMSSDYEEAIKFGATSVRIGSLLFGERQV